MARINAIFTAMSFLFKCRDFFFIPPGTSLITWQNMYGYPYHYRVYSCKAWYGCIDHGLDLLRADNLTTHGETRAITGRPARFFQNVGRDMHVAWVWNVSILPAGVPPMTVLIPVIFSGQVQLPRGGRCHQKV